MRAVKLSHRHLPQSLLGQAIDCTLGQWPALGIYLEDGRIKIDNTLIESCRRRGIEPHAYLRDVLTRLPPMTNWQIKDLTPEPGPKHSAARCSKPNYKRRSITPTTNMTPQVKPRSLSRGAPCYAYGPPNTHPAERGAAPALTGARYRASRWASTARDWRGWRSWPVRRGSGEAGQAKPPRSAAVRSFESRPRER